jgi:hypothetical protein
MEMTMPVLRLDRVLACFLLAAHMTPILWAGEATPEERVDLAVSQLQAGLARGAPEVWDDACARLAREGVEALPALETLATSHDFRVRFLVVRTAQDLLPVLEHQEQARGRELARGRGLLLDGLGDEHPAVRDLARELVARGRYPEAVPILIERLPFASGAERRETVALLTALTRVPIGDAPEAWTQWWQEHREHFTLPLPVEEDEELPRQELEGPTYFGETVSSRNVVFIIDRSKSMEWGGRFGRAKGELVQTIQGLAEEVRFNVLFFGGKVTSWSRRLTQASQGNKKRACHWVMEREIIYSTNTYEALRRALEMPGVDTIYLLSDGDPNTGMYTNPGQICRQVRAVNTFLRVRIFTIGFFFGEVPEEYRDQARDTERTRAFMRRLAEENRGRFVEIDE